MNLEKLQDERGLGERDLAIVSSVMPYEGFDSESHAAFQKRWCHLCKVNSLLTDRLNNIVPDTHSANPVGAQSLLLSGENYSGCSMMHVQKLSAADLNLGFHWRP
ncbi:hypothetical protein CDAR_111441 [Caerostris darwini]|uniref:Uncharacterized protein n=1 Tax=Caerostris darwini TaxID=1538125 RepID=A0AAV4WE81_9ARAC|nr:hypothetical protein CDAR_111441 [Caerostris darwini]